jgi:hypothetical protein
MKILYILFVLYSGNNPSNIGTYDSIEECELRLELKRLEVRDSNAFEKTFFCKKYTEDSE